MISSIDSLILSLILYPCQFEHRKYLATRGFDVPFEMHVLREKLLKDSIYSCKLQNSNFEIISGDVGFDERELLRDAQFEASLYKSPRPDISLHQVQDKSDTMLAEPAPEAQPMEVDLPPAMDGFGGGFMGKLSLKQVFMCGWGDFYTLKGYSKSV